MRLPKGIYEMLPYLYVLAGMASINHFEKFTGYVLGLLLIFMGGVIFLMRANHRQHPAEMR
jgi:hypothetical protein